MQLLELNLWYNNYQDFWPQWKVYKYCGLDARDVVNIELFRDHHFRINTNLLERFHTREEINGQLVVPLVNKLQLNYRQYKEWVSEKFLLSLVKYGTDYGLKEFFETPLDGLPINVKAKNALKSFNCGSISEMTEKYNEEDFLEEWLFTKVIKFKDFMNYDAKKEIFVLSEVLAGK